MIRFKDDVLREFGTIDVWVMKNRIASHHRLTMQDICLSIY